MRAPRISAFRISTRWRSPDRQARRRARRARTGRPKRCAICSSCARASRACDCSRHSGSVPSITLSSTLRLSASVKCWCTMPMPAASAAFGSPGGSARPSTSMCPHRPRSGRTGSTPASLLPAPFSPSSASTSPARSSSEMASLATSAPKRLVMPLRRSSGAASPRSARRCAPTRATSAARPAPSWRSARLRSSTITLNLPSRIASPWRVPWTRRRPAPSSRTCPAAPARCPCASSSSRWP